MKCTTEVTTCSTTGQLNSARFNTSSALLTLSIRTSEISQKAQIWVAMTEQILFFLFVLALLISAFAIITTMSADSQETAFNLCLGVSAGLVGVQIMSVHVFSVVLLVWVFSKNRRLEWNLGLLPSLVLLSSILLASTALWGDRVVNPGLGIQLLILASCSFAIALSVSRFDMAMVLNGLLMVVSFSSILGLLQVFGLLDFGLWHLEVSSVGRPIGLYPEPDWLGLFAGIGLMLSWMLKIKVTLRTFLITVNAASLVLSFARAAWLGTLLCAVILIARRRNRESEHDMGVRRGRRNGVIVVSFLALIAVWFNPILASDLLRRVSTIFVQDTTDISAQARVRQNNGLLELIKTGPWYGNGISASGTVSVWGDVGASGNSVGSNWLLSMYVDGALLALPIILTLLFLAVRARKTTSGLILCLVLVNSLFSNATYFPITWLIIGLAIAELRFAAKGPIGPATAESFQKRRRPVAHAGPKQSKAR